MRTLLRLVLVLAAFAGLLAATVVALAPQTARFADAVDMRTNGVDLSELEGYAVKSLVFAADGSKIGEFYAEENREPVALAFIPETVIEPILAMEDQNFWEHNGVNLKAIMRALFQNVSSGAVEQGGSTITQQLVKNALLSSEQDVDRKTREAVLAMWVDDELTKEEVLQTYLNTVYFGSGAYGVQAAAEIYWGKNVSELNWAEGALLAGLISNPSRFDPTRFPERALERRRIVAESLVAQDKITPEGADLINLTPLPTERCGGQTVVGPVTSGSCGDKAERPPDDYFIEDVKQELLDAEWLGGTPQERYDAVFGGGLRVYTTLDPVAQDAAEKAVAETIPKSLRDKGIVGSLAAVEPTGAVRAMVGGPGYEQLKYNIATQSPGRQTGSSFKTFVLLAALEQGATPNDSIAGGGVFKDGTKAGYKVDGKGGTLTSITTSSSNGAFVRLGQIVGGQATIDTAARLGIDTSKMDPLVLSMPLGVYDVTPMQMASAYSAIPNGGIHEPRYTIDRVEDRNGNIVYQRVPQGSRAVSTQTACLATQILAKNVTGGTGTRARLGKQVAAGKTGTTQDFHDAWFVGFTPYLTTAVWIGDVNNDATMPGTFGGNTPAQIWGNFNKAYHQDRDPLPFPKCDKVGKAKTLKLGNEKVSTSKSTTTKKKSTTSTTKPSTSATTAPPATSAPATTAPPATSPPATDPPATSPPATQPPVEPAPGP